MIDIFKREGLNPGKQIAPEISRKSRRSSGSGNTGSSSAEKRKYCHHNEDQARYENFVHRNAGLHAVHEIGRIKRNQYVDQYFRDHEPQCQKSGLFEFAKAA